MPYRLHAHKNQVPRVYSYLDRADQGRGWSALWGASDHAWVGRFWSISGMQGGVAQFFSSSFFFSLDFLRIVDHGSDDGLIYPRSGCVRDHEGSATPYCNGFGYVSLGEISVRAEKAGY